MVIIEAAVCQVIYRCSVNLEHKSSTDYSFLTLNAHLLYANTCQGYGRGRGVDEPLFSRCEPLSGADWHNVLFPLKSMVVPNRALCASEDA